MNPRLIPCLFLLVVASACAPPAVSETVAPQPRATETSLAPTTAPSETPALTATELPAPSSTPDAVATLLAHGPTSTIGTYDSPNGNWRVEIVRYDCRQFGESDSIAYEQLKLIRMADGVERVIADQMQSCGGLGAFGLGGYGWSPNSRYFYFTRDREGYPDGGAVCAWYRSAFRVEAEIGVEQTLLSGVVSPDAKLIAMPAGNEVVLWDFGDGELARIPAPVEDSPDCAYPGLAAWTLGWLSSSELRLTTQSSEQWTMDVVVREWKKVE